MTLRKLVLWFLTLVGTVVGTWAAFLPEQFHASFPGLGFGPWVAVDGPFNEHLIRDIGALNLGLAVAGGYAALVGGVAASRTVGLAWLVYSVPHLGYHLAHLDGFSAGDIIGQVISLSSTVVLAIPLLLPDRRSGTRAPRNHRERRTPQEAPATQRRRRRSDEDRSRGWHRSGGSTRRRRRR